MKFAQRLTALFLAAILLTGTALAATGMENFTNRAVYTPFQDVAEDAWYADDVRLAYELGLIAGKDAHTFDPMGRLTLAEAVTLAARVSAIYTGTPFTPGGTPWYKNAVDYGQRAGFLAIGEYDDFTQTATRSDMAGIFAFALPTSECPRINRVAQIPDLSFDNRYIDYIYFLYNAGVCTGNGDGSFFPDAPITRAEAAVLLNRLVKRDRRSRISSIERPAGSIVTSPDGFIGLVLPPTWVTASVADPNSAIYQSGDGLVALTLRCAPGDGSASLADYTSAQIQRHREEAGGSILVTQQPRPDLFRGLCAYSYTYQSFPEGGQLIHRVYCLEREGTRYTFTVSQSGNATQEDYNELWTAAYSFDLAL